MQACVSRALSVPWLEQAGTLGQGGQALRDQGLGAVGEAAIGEPRPAPYSGLDWIGLRVDDVFGVTIGTVADVISDPGSDRARWLLVRGGRFGGQYSVVPLGDASVGDDSVWIPYERATVRAAPQIGPTEDLSDQLNEKLDAHYARARSDPVPPILPQSPPARTGHAHRLGRSVSLGRRGA